MDSRIREALERIANECDIGEHTEIARKALLTAEPEPCASSNYSDIPNSSRLPEHYGAGDLVDDLREDERSTSGRMEAPREYVLSYPEACSLVNRYASQVADKRAEELRALVGRLRDELDYSERRLTTSYQSSQSLREEVAQLKELLEEYRQELIKAKEALTAEPEPCEDYEDWLKTQADGPWNINKDDSGNYTDYSTALVFRGFLAAKQSASKVADKRAERACRKCADESCGGDFIEDCPLASRIRSEAGQTAYNHAEVFQRRLASAQDALIKYPDIVTKLVRGYGIYVNEKQISAWLEDQLAATEPKP